MIGIANFSATLTGPAPVDRWEGMGGSALTCRTEITPILNEKVREINNMHSAMENAAIYTKMPGSFSVFTPKDRISKLIGQ